MGEGCERREIRIGSKRDEKGEKNARVGKFERDKATEAENWVELCDSLEVRKIHDEGLETWKTGSNELNVSHAQVDVREFKAKKLRLRVNDNFEDG